MHCWQAHPRYWIHIVAAEVPLRLRAQTPWETATAVSMSATSTLIENLDPLGGHLAAGNEPERDLGQPHGLPKSPGSRQAR